ncbi:unnamed protein product [Heligmosomoides polygyrus]|uniref:Uncharacterized protein n=1 Tax=Heligmosomoides polygyrus TaxID=6339 RepID=A0A183FG79_HELPZ|nr:unnamed protein product [Heligmosomoides polygyrus]
MQQTSWACSGREDQEQQQQQRGTAAAVAVARRGYCRFGQKRTRSGDARPQFGAVSAIRTAALSARALYTYSPAAATPRPSHICWRLFLHAETPASETRKSLDGRRPSTTRAIRAPTSIHYGLLICPYCNVQPSVGRNLISTFLPR